MNLKKTAGLLAMLLGLLGVIGSLIVIVGIWPVSRSVADQITEVIETTEPVLTSVHDKVAKIDSVLGDVDDKLNSIRSSAKNIADKGPDSDPELRAKLDAVSEKASLLLERIENLIETAQSGIVMLQSTQKWVKLLPMKSSDQTLLNPDLIANLEKADKILKTVSGTVTKLKERITDIGEKKDNQKNAKAVLALTDEISDHLNSLKDRVDDSQQRIAGAQEKLVSLKESISYWTTIIPAIIAAIFVWIGLGQWSLFVHGRSMLRSDGQSGE